MAQEEQPSGNEKTKTVFEEMRKAAMALAHQWAHTAYLIQDLASAADESALDESHPQIAERIRELREMFKGDELIEDADPDEAAGT
jgi:hypothetical protein